MAKVELRDDNISWGGIRLQVSLMSDVGTGAIDRRISGHERGAG